MRASVTMKTFFEAKKTGEKKTRPGQDGCAASTILGTIRPEPGQRPVQRLPLTGNDIPNAHLIQ